MHTTGVRAALISELRQLGPRYADAAELLGLTVRFVAGLPGAYAINAECGTVITRDSDEVSIWAAIAQVVADDKGFDADMGMCFEAAVIICRRSGVFNALRIA